MELQEEMWKSFKKQSGQTATAEKFNLERKKSHTNEVTSKHSQLSLLYYTTSFNTFFLQRPFPHALYGRRETWNMLWSPCPVLLTLPDDCGCSETCNDPGQRDAITVRCKQKLSYKHLQEFSASCLMKVLNIWRNGPAVYLK